MIVRTLLTKSQSQTLNSAVDEIIMSNDDETYEEILLKIHSVQGTFSKHENLA